jgi:hypothetical protein
MSGSGMSKSHEPKLTIEREQSILFAYAGQSSLAREARNKIKEKIGQAEITSGLLYFAADEVLTGMRRRYLDFDLQVLIGMSAVSEEPMLFRFDGKGLHEADEFNFLGVGDSCLLHFLGAMMHSPQLSIEKIADLAIYLVRKAEGYITPCDGPINIAIIKSGDQLCRPLLDEDVHRIIRKVETQEGSLVHLNCAARFS